MQQNFERKKKLYGYGGGGEMECYEPGMRSCLQVLIVDFYHGEVTDFTSCLALSPLLASLSLQGWQ